MKFTQLFSNWINGTAKPASSKDQSALLDEARSTILSITERVDSGEIKLASPTEAQTLQFQAQQAERRELTSGALFSKSDRDFLKSNGGSLAKLNAEKQNSRPVTNTPGGGKIWGDPKTLFKRDAKPEAKPAASAKPAPAPAPAPAKPSPVATATKPTAKTPEQTKPAPKLTGLALTQAAFEAQSKGDKNQKLRADYVPPEPTGLARTQAYFEAQSAAKPKAKRTYAETKGLSGRDKVLAAFKAESAKK